jgi:hypothetical protein
MSKDDNAVKDEVVTDTTIAEPATVENQTSDVEDEFDGLGDVSLTDIPTAAETDSPSEEVTPPEKVEETPAPQSEEKPLAPKSENRFQKLANENRELKEQIDRLKTQEDQLATEQGLLNEVNPETGEYYTTQEIERIAFQQSRETQAQQVAQQRYELEVQQNQQTIAQEASQAVKDFPIFDEKSPEYKPELAQLADQRLQKNLIFDENGVLIGAHDSPYAILQTINDALKAGATSGQAEAQAATQKMLANADTTSDAPSKGTGDELDDLFDKVKDVKFA